MWEQVCCQRVRGMGEGENEGVKINTTMHWKGLHSNARRWNVGWWGVGCGEGEDDDTREATRCPWTTKMKHHSPRTMSWLQGII
jgi:hypothetical protein